MEEEFLTVSELCKLLKISRTTADRWRKQGMPFIKVDKGVRFDKVEALKWFKENHNKGGKNMKEQVIKCNDLPEGVRCVVMKDGRTFVSEKCWEDWTETEEE